MEKSNQFYDHLAYMEEIILLIKIGDLFLFSCINCSIGTFLALHADKSFPDLKILIALSSEVV